MTATASNGMFQDVMDWFNTTSGNAQGMAGRATEGFRQGVGIQGVTTPGRAALAGQGLGQLTKGSLNPLVLGLAGLPNFAQGDVVGGIAASGGSILGGLGIKPFLPALAAIPVAGPALAVTGAIAAPYIAGKAAEGVTKMFAGPVQAATQAATTAGGNVINNQLNPNSPRNIIGDSIEQNIELYKQLEAAVGKQAADAYLQQKNLFGLATEADRARAATTAALVPVKTSSELAKMGLGIQGQLALKNLDGGNQVLSNISSTNPYAQMFYA